MRKILLFLLMVIMVSCGVGRQHIQVPVKIDSVYIERVVERIDTVRIKIPGERVYVIKQDSSHLETAVAVSDAKIDSTGMLHHSLTNKDVELKKEIVYKDRVIEKRVEVEKKVPVEVEVPVKYIRDFYKWINILSWCIIGTVLILVIIRVERVVHSP